METGGPVLMPWLSAVPAVVQAWYPGQPRRSRDRQYPDRARQSVGPLADHLPRGGAAQAPRPAPVGLDRLTAAEAQAAADPGHASDHQLASFPIEYSEGADVGYRWYEKTRATPLFPFGHGLSYTSFAYRNPVVKGGAKLSISFEVVNTGALPGGRAANVCEQGWSVGTDAACRIPTRHAEAGESARVTLVAEPRILADYDPTLPGWRVTGGRYRVALAHDARDRALVSTATVTAATMKP